MAVKIVTDSSADLTPQQIEKLGITVVPLYVRFGDEVLRDQIDITADEFYRRLQHDPIHPSTTQPTPQDFANAYQKVAPEADGIVSVHLSAKLSGTCNSAIQGKNMTTGKCPIEVIDSQTLTMGLGMMCIAAAKEANAGGSMDKVVDVVKKMIPRIHLLFTLDTLKYLAKGGRIGKASALLGSVLNVKPMLAIEEGEVVPAGRVRSRSKGIDWLFDFVKNAASIQDLAIIYNTTPDEAQALIERVTPLFTKGEIMEVRLGPMLGVHAGPAALAVAYSEKE